MEVKFYNSLTNSVEVFKPLKEKEVSMYVCGATVYNYPHVGNIRPVVFFDTLAKFLRKVGYEVTYVTNFTDVDDKIILKAQEMKLTERELTDFFIEEYLKVIERFNCDRATSYLRVSECMEEIIHYIDDLVKSGSAYVVDNEVFFDVSKDESYGILSKINKEDLINGARIEVSLKKKSPLDFLLWKNTDVGIKWDSPWGRGRPGWHTECVVMINKTFHGEIDIHGGGSDLKFPHHENEIAQCSMHDHHKLARFWIHNAMMDINGEKMSKSLGNVILANDLVDQFGSNLSRLVLLNAPYRSNINFNDQNIENNKKILDKIVSCYKQCNLYLGMNDIELKKDKDFTSKFLECLADDMNIPNGITELLNIIKELNVELRKKEKDSSLIRDYFVSLQEILDVLGLKFEFKKYSKDERETYLEYLKAKEEKDFTKSDELRNRLIDLQII